MGLGGHTEQGADARDARIAELEAQLNATRVENGRVRALSAELAKAQEEAKEARQKLEAASRDYGRMVPEDLRDTVSAESVRMAGSVAEQVASIREDRIRQEMAEMENRMKAEGEQAKKLRLDAFYSSVEARYPGLIRSINPGGDKEQAWQLYRDAFGPSIDYALNSLNMPVLSRLIDGFLAELGVSSRGGDQTSPMTPRQTSGGSQQAGMQAAPSGTTMTFEQYSAALDKAGTDNRAGRSTGAEYQAIVQELNKALKEGRVAKPSAKLDE